MRVLQGVISVVIVFFFVGCNNEPDTRLSGEEKSAVSAEKEYNQYANDMQSVVQAAMEQANADAGGRTAENQILDCAEVSISGDKTAGTIRVDFGDGCEGPYGHVRKGVIEIEYTGNYLVKGSSYTLESIDFYIDDVKVEGTRTATNISETIAQPAFRVTTTDGRVTWPDETFITREEERVHTFSYDLGEQVITLEVTGSASGLTRLGEEYTSTIEAPLFYESDCLTSGQFLPSSGVILIKRPDKPDINADFGDGSCDGKVSVTIGSVSVEVEI
jgi:hypothetical protein